MINAVIGAITGAIAGILGTLLARKIHTKEKVKKYLAIYIIIIFIPLNSLLLSKYNPSDPFDKKIENEMLKKLSPTTYKMIMEKNNSTYTQSLSQKGIRRLGFTDLMLWNQLRLTIAKNSKSICSGLWSGKMSAIDIKNGLKSLSDKDFSNWAHVSAMAIENELKEEPYIKVTPEKFQEALKELALKLNENDKIRFVTIFQQGLNANDEDGCFAMLEMMKFIDSNRDQNSEYLARFIAEIMAQQSK